MEDSLARELVWAESLISEIEQTDGYSFNILCPRWRARDIAKAYAYYLKDVVIKGVNGNN